MKTLLVVFLLIIFNGLVFTQSWFNHGTADFSSGGIDYPSLEIASDGTVYAAFQDKANSYKITVMKYNGSNWVAVGTAGFSGGQADYIDLDISPSGELYVVFKDHASSLKTTVMKFNTTNSTWEVVGTAGFSAGVVYSSTSIAIASDETPYVAYSDEGNSYKITVKKYNGSNWVDVGSAGFSDAASNNISLVFAPGNIPYVGYQNAAAYTANVMKYDGSSWANVGALSALGNAYTPSLVITSAGVPYIGASFGASSLSPYVYKFNGTSWEVVGSISKTGYGEYITMALSASDIPYLAFVEFGLGSRASVIKYNGTSWEDVGSRGFTGGAAPLHDLKISPNGIPVFLYQDGANSDKASVLKFASSASDALPVELTSFAAAVTGNSTSLVWQTATEVNNYGFNIERRLFDANASSLGHSSLKNNWLTIGLVLGYGNSNSPKSYSFVDSNPPSGIVQYRIKQIDFDGKFEYSNIVEVNIEHPVSFALEQNYPNPFNPITTIKYSIPQDIKSESQNVRIFIYDILGNHVATLVNERLPAGNYQVSFDGSSLASGVYFCKMQTGSYNQTKKLVLMK